MGDKQIKTVIFAVVAILFITAIAIPITSQLSDSISHTYDNRLDGVPSLAYEKNNEAFKDHTVTLEDMLLTVDGIEYDLTTVSTPYTAIVSNDFACFAQNAGHMYCYFDNVTVNVTSLTMTLSNGTLTYNVGADDVTLEYDFLYILDKDGNYAYNRLADTPYVNVEDDVGVNYVGINHYAAGLVIVHDGLVYVNGEESTEFTLEETFNATGTADVKELQNVKLHEGTLTFINLVVPDKIVVESIENGPIVSTLISIVPILLIVSVVVAIVGSVIYRKFE